MDFNTKNVLDKQSIIKLTLLKVISLILAFLLIFMFIYGKNFWEKQTLQFNDNLLLSASKLQAQIQSRISTIEELKQNKDLPKTQKLLQIENIIQPMINENENNSIYYYDLELELITKSQNTKNSFDENTLFDSGKAEFNKILKKNNFIYLNLPIYNKDKLVGYVLVYTKNTNFVSESFHELSQIIILGLSLSVIIIFF
ncbi:hypothetical protein JT05_05930, partial [Desulfosporosinus sp. Tol-M]